MLCRDLQRINWDTYCIVLQEILQHDTIPAPCAAAIAAMLLSGPPERSALVSLPPELKRHLLDVRYNIQACYPESYDDLLWAALYHAMTIEGPFILGPEILLSYRIEHWSNVRKLRAKQQHET